MDRDPDPDPSIINLKIVRKTMIPIVLWLFCDFLFLKKWSKGTFKKWSAGTLFFNYYFVGVLKVNYEK